MLRHCDILLVSRAEFWEKLSFYAASSTEFLKVKVTRLEKLNCGVYRIKQLVRKKQEYIKSVMLCVLTSVRECKCELAGNEVLHFRSPDQRL